MARSAIFLAHLLQDVHVLRPLIFMAARDFGFRTQLLVSDRFRARDTSGVWLSEIEAIRAQTGAAVHFFGDSWEARRHLTGQGLLFAASESHIHNHAIAHDIFRHAPASFLKVTLQHGFECVGFRHGADHIRAYGQTASFGADILCAWFGRDHLTALAPSQAPKVVVTGPTSMLQMATGPIELASPEARPGLVCENLHSVRFESADKLEQEFLRTFGKFAGAMHRQRHLVRLRPHPGGQYSAKAGAVLPRNVQLENAPLYRLDLRQFCYGISPPSSVLIDMLLADIPTAVWRDWRGRIDVGNYEGLITVSSADELIRFAQDAVRDRDRLIMSQRRWLEQQGMPLEPADVYARFAQLFEAAERVDVRRPGSRAERERVLVVTDQSLPMPPRMEKALAAVGANGEVASTAVAAEQLAGPGVANEQPDSPGMSVATLLEAHDPSVIFLCGQGVNTYKAVIRWAKDRQVPLVYFPGSCEVGGAPEEGGSGVQPEEVAGKSELLHGADVIYASTEQLKARLKRAFPDLQTVVGPNQLQDPVQQPLSVFRDELLGIIALGHAAVGARNRQAQKENRAW